MVTDVDSLEVVSDVIVDMLLGAVEVPIVDMLVSNDVVEVCGACSGPEPSILTIGGLDLSIFFPGTLVCDGAGAAVLSASGPEISTTAYVTRARVW